MLVKFRFYKYTRKTMRLLKSIITFFFNNKILHSDIIIEWKLNAFYRILSVYAIGVMLPMAIIFTLMTWWHSLILDVLLIFTAMPLCFKFVRKGYLYKSVYVFLSSVTIATILFILDSQISDGLFIFGIYCMITTLFLGVKPAMVWTAIISFAMICLALTDMYTFMPELIINNGSLSSIIGHSKHISSALCLTWAVTFISILIQKQITELLAKVIRDNKRLSQEILHREQIEQSLRHSEKMQAFGQLAGGMAHDFNNQIAGIVGNTELLVSKLESNSPLLRYTDNILTVSNHASGLTKKLLAFARKGTLTNEPVNIHSIITEVCAVLRNTFDRRISICYELHASLYTVMADATMIQSAILNIAINARDAMPSGGKICCSTINRTFSNEDILKNPYIPKPGSYIEIRIADNGTGMTKETKQKIFEPFFTTKELGKGTGMGMAAVYGTITNHQGGVTVESEVGKGTSIILFLPASEISAQKKALGDTNVSLNKVRKGRILIVDDEETIRLINTEILEETGFSVSSAINGKEAVALYKTDWKSIDLILLDMNMPEMNGKETFRQLRSINPKAKVILFSGYTNDEDTQSLLDSGLFAILPKPSKRDSILNKVDAALCL
jgi:signal transduction histidine kinase